MFSDWARPGNATPPEPAELYLSTDLGPTAIAVEKIDGSLSGKRIHLRSPGREPGEAEAPEGGDAPGRFELLAGETLYGTEPLSACSPHLMDLEIPPGIIMSAADAADLGIESGGRLTIDTGRGVIVADVAVSGAMASGCLVVPRHPRIGWQSLGDYCMNIDAGRIERGRP